MADAEFVSLNDPHTPYPNAIEAFTVVLDIIKHGITKSRREWDKHEPKMWSRAAGLSDHELTAFNIADDLVLVRSGPTSYGTIILGKIRIPAVNDDLGEGFVHVRCAPARPVNQLTTYIYTSQHPRPSEQGASACHRLMMSPILN
jgi:hypothetical protein